MKENVIIRTKAKIWTRNGLDELGKMIRSSREAQKLNLRDAAELITQLSGESILFSTLGEVERGVVMPKFNTLSAIAASRLATCERGVPLNIYDFIDIASENFRVDGMEVLVRLIKLELESQGWTLRRMAQECGMEFADLFDIYEGRESEDFFTDLILLGSILTNPTTGESFGNAEDIIEFCGLNLNNHKSA